MIDFRYHLVSLVALFLALAGGIALGAGPLQDPVRGELSAGTSDSGSAQALQGELDRVERLNDFRARYDEGTASLVLGDRLAGTSVAMIVRVYEHFRNQSYLEAQETRTSAPPLGPSQPGR